MTNQTTAPLIGIVDDDEAVCVATSSLLRSLGYRTALFASAEAFLDSDQIPQIDCLIVDIHMPGLSGLELPRLLTEVNHPIPIIFVTAHEDESRAKALGQGAAAILSKPFSREELLAAIQSALECSER